MSAPAWSPGAMVEASPAYRVGYDYAKAELADAPREVREAASRNMAAEQATTPANSKQHLAFAGALAYLTERHESNQPNGAQV